MVDIWVSEEGQKTGWGRCTGERTGIDDEKVLLLMLVDVADAREQKTGDGVLY